MAVEHSNKTDPDEQILRGVIERVTFRNPENGYAVLQLAVPDRIDRLTVVGNCFDVNIGTHVIVRGTFINHPKFGRQFSARSITETAPETPDALIRYLGSGLVKGIGEKTAAKIVAEFGTETMEILLRTPEKIGAIEGVGEHRALLLAQHFAGQQEMREILRFLIEHNMSQNLALKIYERYGSMAVETLTKDPYILARTAGIRGVGFLTADSIAMNLGLKPHSPQRIKAGIYYALEKSVDDGHCFLAWNQLAERSRELLQLSTDIELEPFLEALIEEGGVINDESAIYLRHLHRAEKFVASFIAPRCTPYETPQIDEYLVDNCLKAAEEELKIEFSREQREAVLSATKHPLLIITGGPGCGKTTIIKALALLFKMAHKRLALAAPTGRAAQRMSQVCSMNASTIHRLLRYDPTTGGFIYGINEPLEIDALIIDETSMVDLMLAKDLFSAIPKGASIILVGDKDQLPSVGPGRVFGDLLALTQIKTISLSRLFRRAEESAINATAHSINSGIVPSIAEPDGKVKSDAYLIRKSDAGEAAALVESLVADQIPRKFGIASHEIMVLTPSNRGPLGTLALNKQLQAKINPPGILDIEQELQVGETIFRVGDRVCQRVNNYQIDAQGVFNGDTGTIYNVNKPDRCLTVELWDGRLVKYTSSDLLQLSHAYAITVHRSQGSEIPCVVLALHESHYTLLERQLIYTGVTRAKRLLIIVGSKHALQIACRRTSTSRRCTRLKERIVAALT